MPNYTTHTIPYKPYQVACQDDMIAETKAVSDDSNHDDEDNNYMNLDKEAGGDENLFLDDFANSQKLSCDDVPLCFS